MIGFDTELTQFGLENPTSKISSFHLADESKFNRLQELMIKGYKEFKAHPILKESNMLTYLKYLKEVKMKDKLLLRFHNKSYKVCFFSVIRQGYWF